MTLNRKPKSEMKIQERKLEKGIIKEHEKEKEEKFLRWVAFFKKLKDKSKVKH